MRWPLAIVCYHRVLPDSQRVAEGRPYFARGTAVSESNFLAHVKSIVRHFDVVSSRQALDWHAGAHEFTRPSCWITFDDGYREIYATVAPILKAAGVPATAFVTTAATDGKGFWLPADRWYATVNHATRRRGVLPDVGGAPWEFDVEQDFSRFVDGPERRAFLTSPRGEQDRAQAALAKALGVDELPPADLYLDWADVARLAEEGWTIGGHGASHAILTRVSAKEAANELVMCRDALRVRGLAAELFAYPDGAYDGRVTALAAMAGWDAAVVLENRTACRADSVIALPRFIACDDPQWVEKVLQRAYAMAGQDG